MSVCVEISNQGIWKCCVCRRNDLRQSVSGEIPLQMAAGGVGGSSAQRNRYIK